MRVTHRFVQIRLIEVRYPNNDLLILALSRDSVFPIIAGTLIQTIIFKRVICVFMN